MSEEGIVSLDDAINIGLKVVEMADRLRVADKAAPGCQAKLTLDMEDDRYELVMTFKRGGAAVMLSDRGVM